MESTFLEKIIEKSYTEKDIARVFNDALDQTIYNMLVKDFMSRTGVNLNEVIAIAKDKMIADFNTSAIEKNITLDEETYATFKTGINNGAAQLKENLGLED